MSEIYKCKTNNVFSKHFNAFQPLRQQPDYCCQTTEEKMNQIAKQLYQQSNIVSQIVKDLYFKQVKNASQCF